MLGLDFVTDTTARAERRIDRRAARLQQSIRCASIAVAVCVVIWAASGGGAFWPGWVILGTAISVAVKARKVREAFDRADGDGYRTL